MALVNGSYLHCMDINDFTVLVPSCGALVEGCKNHAMTLQYLYLHVVLLLKDVGTMQ